MSLQLHGENFQSWGSFDLTGEGLTVVVGPSNLGKSAIVRALKAVMRNTINAAQVRQGSDGIKLEVVIDGHTVIAERPKSKKGSVTYNVDGKDFEKLDGDIPQPVLDLGLNVLEIGKLKLDPVFAGQFGEQFILQCTDQELSSILGAFSSTEQLEFGKRTANGRINEKNTEAKLLAKELRSVEERRAKLSVLADKAAEIETALHHCEADVTRNEDTIAALDTLIVHLDRLNHLQALLAKIQVPDTEPVAHSMQLMQAYGAAAITTARHLRVQSALGRLVVPETKSVAHGIQLTQVAAEAVITKGRHQRLQVAIDQLIVPEADTALTLHKKALAADQASRAQVRFLRATAATEAIAVCVTGWTDIVAQFQRGKAIHVAEQALESFTSSRSKEYIARLDAHSTKIDSLVKEVTRVSGGIRGLGDLIANCVSLDALRASLPAAEEEVNLAQAALDLITSEHQAHQQELAIAAAQQKAAKEAAAAAAAGKKCPTCGATITKS